MPSESYPSPAPRSSQLRHQCRHPRARAWQACPRAAAGWGLAGDLASSREPAGSQPSAGACHGAPPRGPEPHTPTESAVTLAPARGRHVPAPRQAGASPAISRPRGSRRGHSRRQARVTELPRAGLNLTPPRNRPSPSRPRVAGMSPRRGRLGPRRRSRVLAGAGGVTAVGRRVSRSAPARARGCPPDYGKDGLKAKYPTKITKVTTV